jgi:hypothetical protein
VEVESLGNLPKANLNDYLYLWEWMSLVALLAANHLYHCIDIDTA